MNNNIKIITQNNSTIRLIDENMTINELMNTYFITYLERHFLKINIFIKYIRYKNESLSNRNLEELLAIGFEEKNRKVIGLKINDYINLMNNNKYSKLFTHEIHLEWGKIKLEFDNNECIYDEFEMSQIDGEIKKILLMTK